MTQQGRVGVIYKYVLTFKTKLQATKIKAQGPCKASEKDQNRSSIVTETALSMLREACEGLKSWAKKYTKLIMSESPKR